MRTESSVFFFIKKESTKQERGKNLSDISSLLLSWNCRKKYFPKMIFYEFRSRLCLLNQYFCISDNISYTRDDEEEPRRNSKVICHPTFPLYIRVCLWIQNK
ncbi:hypothetical protein ACKWTF_005025 [Chironomus riparius]